MTHKEVKRDLKPLELIKKTICSIEIHCTEAATNGEMQVEMNYEGDACLASVLLQDALRFFHDKMEEEELSEIPTKKIVK